MKVEIPQRIINTAEATATNATPPPRNTLFSPPKVNVVMWSLRDTPIVYSKQNYILDILSAFLFSRVVYILLAEQESLDWSSVLHTMMVILPFYVTIQQIVFYHDIYIAKSDMIDYIYTVLRAGVLVGLGYTAPSTYVSSIANLPSFIFFLFLSRGFHACALLMLAFYDAEVGANLMVNGLLSVVSMFIWISGLFQSRYNMLYLLFEIGVLADLLAIFVVEGVNYTFTCQRKRRFMKRSQRLPSRVVFQNHKLIKEGNWRIIGLTNLLVISGILNIFPSRQGQDFPSSIVSVPFDYVQIIFVLLSCLYLFSMYVMYDTLDQIYPIETGEDLDDIASHDSVLEWYSWTHFYSTLSVWLHCLLWMAIIVSMASLQLVVADLYANVGPIPKLDVLVPYNMSLPVNAPQQLMNLTLLRSDPLNYLSKAVNLLNNPQSFGSARLNTFWNPASMFLISSGCYLILLSVLEYLWQGERCPPPVFVKPKLNRHIWIRSSVGLLIALMMFVPAQQWSGYNATVIAVLGVVFFVFSVHLIYRRISMNLQSR
ncbi:hypothetical protein EDD86DRAFT_206407 [Gorgonomyces haynaldii]|nr:hypothetical protein EDD86DRAFT_206407 [Gorgonomyces haynaldii]